MKTKVAIVLPYFSSGGAQMMVSRLVSRLDLSETEAEVICVYGEPQNNRMEKAISDHGIPIRYIGKKKGFSIGAILRLNRELSRFDPDVVHSHLSAGVYCAAWIMSHHVTLLHTVHNIPDKELLKIKQLVMKMLYRRKAAVPVAISHEIRSLVKAHYGIDTVELIYNPVDIGQFSRAAKKQHSNFVAVNAGRLSPQKNHQLLIKAFIRHHKKYGEDELYILGDGPCRPELEKLIRENGAENYINLEGNVDNVAGYFAGADVFVLSSEYEGLPLVVLEAMAASLPVISTDVGGVRDIVSDFENGILTESGSEEELIKALRILRQDREKARAMGERSFALVQKYDTSVIAKEYSELYRKYS